VFNLKRYFLVTSFLVLCSFPLQSQNLVTDFPVLEEYLRRSQLLGDFNPKISFQLRSVNLSRKDTSEGLITLRKYWLSGESGKLSKFHFSLLPLILSTEINSKRPYGWGNKGMIPNVGLQTYFSAGFYARLAFLEIQFQPEFIYAQNKAFQGFNAASSTSVIQSRFFYWNDGDNPERFGQGPRNRSWWGQSAVRLNAGSFSLELGTGNLWWGPGQFNSLIFSDNSEGFPHLSLKTNKPVKTFMGNFEGQLMMGRLENSLLPPSQNQELNKRFFEDFSGDWRYLNGLSITFNPSFLPNLFFGFNRTLQQYNGMKGNGFRDWFPVLEVFQKEKFFDNGSTVVFDSRGQDQQASVSFRYLVPSARFEVYGEFGRRDHAFNWGEFILNPEHARAYLVGFQKLFALSKKNEFIQVRAEMTHQQESVNRYIRYPGLIGNQTWHTHGLARGFVNYGQTLGVGSGVGANVQTLEISKVMGFSKRGVLFERLENHQDFFYRAFGQNPEKEPWIDLSLGLLFDQKWKQFIFSSKTQVIYAQNYQWNSEGLSTNEFPNGQKQFSLFGTFHLIYQISSH
jgi:hypothetical protein